MPVEIPKDSWAGAIRTVTIGATTTEGGTRSRVVTVGGQKTLPFMHFEGETPNRPVVAVEIKDRRPEDWSPLLVETWGDVTNDPAAWAKAAEAAGADLLVLALSLTDANGNPNTPQAAVATTKAVLQASGYRCWCGGGSAEMDNELLVAIARRRR
jgi:acetyl-CoA decarbonylase/synthase complex subunit delta